MSVDLIGALEARGNERTGSADSQGSGNGEFPEVLQSRLDETSRSRGDRERNLGDSSTGNSLDGSTGGKAQPDGAAGSGSGSDGDEMDRAGTDEEDSTLEGAALGVGVSALAATRRGGQVAASDLVIDGRLSVLDAGRNPADSAEGGRDLVNGRLSESSAGIAQGRELTAEEAAGVTAAIDAELASAGGGTKAGLDGDVVAGGAALAGANQEGLGVLRAGAETLEGRELDSSNSNSNSSEDRREGTDGGSRGEEEGRRNSEQALFDRAAEGAQSPSVDPGLRAAMANSEAARQAPESVVIEGAGVIANPVAGAVTETTTTSTPGAPTSAAASDAIAVQTEWLATRGGGTARLILSPPNLGEIAIQVTLHGGSVNIVMVAQEAIAQSVAEDQADRLAQAFANRDLRLDGFEVRRGNPESLANGDLDQFAESKSQHEGAAEDDAAGRDGDRTADGSAQSQATERLPLAQPQILSTGPETGVDLRI